MGEDVGVFQGAFKVTEGLLEEFGERRVATRRSPRTRSSASGVGAAMAGLRPVVEIMTVNFSLLAMDQIVNHAAAIPYMFNGQVRVPMVIRMPARRRTSSGPPTRTASRRCTCRSRACWSRAPRRRRRQGLLKAAIRDDNPVIFIEHETLYGVRGEVPENGDEMLRFGQAAIRREGET